MSRSYVWQTMHQAYGGHFDAAHRARSEALRAIVRAVTSQLTNWRRRRRKRAAIRDLQALDDHLLTDINLSRATIRDAVEGMLERERER